MARREVTQRHAEPGRCLRLRLRLPERAAVAACIGPEHACGVALAQREVKRLVHAHKR
jgi:hypothetical protein